MTLEKKREALRALLAPDNDTDEVLDATLEAAAALVLDRLYPFGNTDLTEVPVRLEQIQVQLAVELYSKRGAEGQVVHQENGISRQWPEVSALLRRIHPHVGSVMDDA